MHGNYTADDLLDLAWDAQQGAAYESFAAADEPPAAAAADSEADSEESDGVVCSELRRVIEAADTAAEVMDALKAHRVQCAACMCEHRDVQSDRIHLAKPMAVCCGMTEVA